MRPSTRGSSIARTNAIGGSDWPVDIANNMGTETESNIRMSRPLLHPGFHGRTSRRFLFWRPQVTKRPIQQQVVTDLQRASDDERASERHVLHDYAGDRWPDGPCDVSRHVGDTTGQRPF